MKTRLAFATVLAFFVLGHSSRAAEPRPNVVLLMGDDHGWEETGYNGHPHVKTPVLDRTMTTRPTPLYFWQYNTGRFAGTKPVPYLAPELQAGTTPLAKLMGGKATRDFTNWRHPALTEADYLGARSIIEGPFKLVIHEQKNGPPRRELFDLEADPAERTNLIEQQAARAERLQKQLRAWQDSVLRSLTGADYAP